MPHVRYNRPGNRHRDPHVSAPEKFGGLQGQPRFGQDALSAHSSVDIAMEDAEFTPRLLSDFDLDLTGDQEMQAYRMLKDWICWRYVTRAFGQFLKPLELSKCRLSPLGEAVGQSRRMRTTGFAIKFGRSQVVKTGGFAC
uniref:Uncharacterized protein n=1 Tax=Oryza sativa subsp. japonica TaxID=39947 RepID=Q6Z637_ORYSJ|nr:hypothetical protein [Oryza sativa Japonica Group]BAD05482.1 hypothetical protein [Oryza sativa Japonica Group]